MGLKKYLFIEDFPADAEGDRSESPKLKSTKNFGDRMLHRIARCEYDEHEEKGVKWVTLRMGERGGWIEKYGNLSQEGESWVEDGGTVCMDAFVSGDAVVKGGEVGDSATVTGNAEISGNACIKDRCKVFGSSKIGDDSVISGRATVDAVVKGSSEIGGRVIVRGFFTLPYVEIDYKDESGESVGTRSVLQKSEKDKAEIEDTKVDGSSIILGVFSIKDCEIGGNTVIHGNTASSVTMEEVKTTGNSRLSGTFIGPMEMKDVTVTGVAGEYNGGLDGYVKDDRVKLIVTNFGR